MTYKMCDKPVTTYHSTIKFVLDCYKTQEMRDKGAANKYFLAYRLMDVKLKKCVAELVPKFLLCWYIALINIRLRMCDEAVDDCLAALKFIPDWFTMS